MQHEAWRAVRPGLKDELFCKCQTTYDEDKQYVGCEGVCDGWFHIECIGIDELGFEKMSNARYSKPWHCEGCAKKMGKRYWPIKQN